MPRRFATAASEPSSPASSCCTTVDASPADPALAAWPGGHHPLVMRINLASCKYPVLRVVQRQLGWVEVDDEDAHVHWCDTSAGTDVLVRLARPQKLNHFPGMLEIARKKALARNLAAMRSLFPEEYDFSPRSFLLPEMMEAFEAELVQARQRGGKDSNGGRSRRPTFILKLDNGSMGRGIKLVQTHSQALAALPTFEHENVVASQYIDRPLLIDGKKFDLRIYVLVRCCNPLRIFLYQEGLVRFCTEEYEPPGPGNLGNAYAHLTNYAVNKTNPAFVFNEDAQQSGTGSKWKLSAFALWMREQGRDFKALWAQVAHIVCKTLIAAQPMLQYQYDCATRADDDGLMCFELLGFDVLVDEDFRPWLLEVNHSPSLTTDTPLDLEIKSRLVREVLALAGAQPQRVQAELAARERAKHARLYKGHAACVVHSLAAAATPPAGSRSPRKGAKPLFPETGAPSGCPPGPMSEPSAALPAESGAAGLATTGDQPGATTPSPCGSVSPGPDSTAAGLSACCALTGPAAGEPARGSPDWEAMQREYEDAHLGQFDRIMPPVDSERAALYEKLLGGALQVFYRSTMQGRNQHRLLQIRERRLQEEAEAAARQEAQQRRAESLRAWMAAVCQRHREERQLRASAAAAEGAVAGSDTDLVATYGLDADSGSGGSMDGGSSGTSRGAGRLDCDAVLQGYLLLPGLKGSPSHAWQQPEGAHRAAAGNDGSISSARRRRPSRGTPAGSEQDVKNGRAGPSLSVSGMPVGVAARHGQLPVVSPPVSSTDSHPVVASPQPAGRPWSDCAQLSHSQLQTTEDVRIVASDASAGGGALAEQESCPAKTMRSQLLGLAGSAAPPAWAEAVTQQQGQQGSSGSVALQPHPQQQQDCDTFRHPVLAAQRGTTASSRFLDRETDITGQQQAGAECELSARRLLHTSDMSGPTTKHSGSDQDSMACSADGSVLAACSKGPRGVSAPAPAACGMGNPPAPPQLDATYIPPALLSALRSVHVGQRLQPGLHGKAGAAAVVGQAGAPLPQERRGQHSRARRRGAGGIRPDRPTGSGNPKGGARTGAAAQAALDAPWALSSLQQAGCAPRSPCSQLSFCKGTPGGAPAEPAGQRKSRASVSGKPGQQGPGVASLPAASAEAMGQPGLWTGSQAYRASIERQAVQSVASLISSMINTSGL